MVKECDCVRFRTVARTGTYPPPEFTREALQLVVSGSRLKSPARRRSEVHPRPDATRGN